MLEFRIYLTNMNDTDLEQVIEWLRKLGRNTWSLSEMYTYIVIYNDDDITAFKLRFGITGSWW